MMDGNDGNVIGRHCGGKNQELGMRNEYAAHNS